MLATAPRSHVADELATEVGGGADVVAAGALLALLDPVDLVPVSEVAEGVFQHLAVPVGGGALDVEAEAGRLQVDRRLLARLQGAAHPGGWVQCVDLGAV